MDYIQKYGYVPDQEETNRNLQAIASNLESLQSEEALRFCFSCMDLTTLNPSDTEETVGRLVAKVNRLRDDYPSYPLPASVCVYPNFARVVASRRTDPGLHVTVVSGCFPSAQSFAEVKVQECRMAVRAGAEEMDIVLALNAFLAGDKERAAAEIAAVRKAVDEEGAALGRKVTLKVILETGLLKTPENIAEASLLAMEAGADFIKTSTGKVEVNATPTAAYVMCRCIAAYYARTSRKVGFKAAGGISNSRDAMCYYLIVSSVLGKEWLDKGLFRLGVSRLGNSLMSDIEQRTVSYF